MCITNLSRDSCRNLIYKNLGRGSGGRRRGPLQTKKATCQDGIYANLPPQRQHGRPLANPAAGFGQWRRQWLMVGEAHLVGEANIFNVKYIIHECGLPTICRPPPGRHLLDRYTYLPRFATFF